MGASTLLIVLTARMGSERRPGKVLADIGGRPLLTWIAERLSEAGQVVLATTWQAEDAELAIWAAQLGLPCYRGSPGHVLKRIIAARDMYAPDAILIMRGLGDCPFPQPSYITRAAELLLETGYHSFAWALPPWSWPAYGAREFPMSVEGWQRLAALAQGHPDMEEHPDLGLHRNRGSFSTVYHEPPPHYLFRPHRIEVDTQADLDMLRVLKEAHGVGWPTLSEALRILDARPDIAAHNRGIAERTGPLASYTQAERNTWVHAMAGQVIHGWQGERWALSAKDRTIFCQAGCCLVGTYQGGILRLLDGSQVEGRARITCSCGAGRSWYP